MVLLLYTNGRMHALCHMLLVNLLLVVYIKRAVAQCTSYACKVVPRPFEWHELVARVVAAAAAAVVLVVVLDACSTASWLHRVCTENIAVEGMWPVPDRADWYQTGRAASSMVIPSVVNPGAFSRGALG